MVKISTQTPNYPLFLLFFGAWLFLLTFFQNQVVAQTVIIPRDGFPYCEPFTNSTTRANTVFDGIPNPAFLTAGAGDPEGGGYLQLTDNTTDERGYVFIDLPFSSAYGIKVSFEYFAYGGINPPAFADGISFFMFDGDIGPSDFQIGGLGGSLGYAPWRRNVNMTAIPDQPGLKGGYIGIGFDAFRNWGNEYEGRFGGFKDPSGEGFGPVPDERQYYNSIAIRGPESVNYQFIDGKRTFSRSFLNEEQPLVYTDPIDPGYYLFNSLDPVDYLARRFKIGADNLAELCTQDGYRKVFIDLFPIGGGNYLVTVDMLVNNGGTLRLENIFTDVPYNFPAPKNLKIGFAASTGTPNTNFHRIRNVTAQVSDYASIPIPEIDDLRAEVCEGDENLFEFDVNLTSDNSFLRCVQLFENNPGPPDNSPPTGGDPSLTNCGLSNVCIEKCDPNNNSITLPGKGTFTVELEELTTGNFDEERFAASVRFIPEPGFVGTAEIYYQVLDNYGLLSEANTITVVSNPDPIKNQDPTITNPTCDGQSDGLLADLIVGDLVAGFDYEWLFNGISIGKTGASVGPLTGDEASFELQGLNIGTYTLVVWNPSDNGRCETRIDVTVDQEQGTPVDIELNDQVICEGQEVNFNPIIDPAFGSDAGAEFFWYLSADRAGGAITNGSTRVIDGETISFQIINEREIVISGLVSNGNSFKDYVFYVEAKEDNPGGNFCPYIGDVLSVARVTVYPPLDFTASKTSDDFCLENTGSIQANEANASDITYYLTDPSGNIVDTNTSGNFTGLTKGNYEVFATSTNPACNSEIIEFEILGPDQPLTLVQGNTLNAFCGDPNGQLDFTIDGGNAGYTVSLNGTVQNGLTPTGNLYSIPGLAAGTYTILVSDTEGCTAQISMTISGDPITQFDSTDDEICEGETATLSPQVIEQSSSTPSYTWFYQDGSGNYIQINNGASDGQGTFTLSGDELQVAGLASSNSPYTYYLQVNGSRVCDQGYIPAEIIVNPIPALDTPVLNMISCFGANNGSIQAQVSSGNLSDFSYSLVGNNSYTSNGFQSNNGLFTNLAPGTYELTVRNAGNCEAIISDLVLTAPPLLELVELNAIDASCEENNGEISFEISGGSPDASGTYSITVNGADISSFGTDLTQPTSNTFTISNLGPGTYQIEASDDNGCPSSLTILVEDLPTPEFDVVDVSICEGTDALLTPVVVSNTIGAIPSYQWFKEDQANPGQYLPINDGDQEGNISYSITSGELTISGLINSNSPYTFYLEVTGDGVCPDDLIPAQVEVLKIPEAIFSAENVSCFGGNDGTISLESLDPSGSFTFTIVETGEGNTSGDFSNLGAGVYTIRIQEDGAPCFSEEVIEITQPDELQILNVNSTNPTCGEFNGSFSFELIGGTPDYTIQINNLPITDFSNSLNGNQYEIRNLEPGTYSVEVIDGNNCSLSVSNMVSLVNDDGLTVALEPMESEVCLGLEAVILPEFTSSLPVTPVLKWYKDAALTQTVTNGTDAEGISYQIDASNGELTIEGLPEGTRNYYLEISGPGICTLVETAEVMIYPALTASFAIDNITCFGDTDGSITVNPSGGNGNFEVSMNGGPFTGDLIYNNLAAGDYTFEVQNDIGCVYTETVTVEGPDQAIEINNPTIVRASCDLDNGSIQDLVISGGWGNYTVEWRRGSETGPIVPGTETGITDLAPDTYFLLLTDAEGCPAIFDFEIEESSDPVYQIVPPINDCVGNDVRIRPIHLAPDPSLPPAAATEVRWYKEPGQVSLIADGPDPDNASIEYSIDDSDWLNPELLITGLPAGDYTYYFYVVCTGQELEVEVSIYDTPAVTLEVSPITCFGDSNGTISFTGGTNADYTYSLDGASPVDQAAIESLTLPAGDYQLEVFTPASCSQVIDFTIEGPTAPLEASPLTGIDPGCGSANGKLFTTITGGWAPYEIEVFRNGTSIESHTSSDGNVELDGFTIGEYYLVITDAEGCSISTNTLELVDGPTQILVDEVEVCANDVATLSPILDPLASNTTFEWYFDQALTQPINSSATPASDGLIYQFDSGTGVLNISGFDTNGATLTYFVTVSGPSVCEGFVGEGVVEVFGIPSGTATVVDEVCFGDGGQITVNATGGSGSYTYSLNGGAFVNDPVFNVSTGTYTVEILSSAGCSILLEDIEVRGPDAALEATNLELDSPTCGLENGIIRFDINGGYPSYTVYFSKDGAAENSIVVNQAGSAEILNIGVGNYQIRVVDDAGCEIAIPQEIEVTEVPTAITAEDQRICLGETATLTPSVPQNIPDEIFTWYFDANGTQPISSGTNAGITYNIASNGALSIEGLEESGSPYTYYVNAIGTGICGIEPKPVQVFVNRIPDLRVSNPSVVCDPDGTVDLTRYIEGFNPDVYEYDILSPAGTAMQLSDIDEVDLSGDYRVSSSIKGSGCWNAPQRIRVIIADELLVANFDYEVDLGDGNLISNDTIQIFEEIQFEDLSLGKVILWTWDFGDGTTSGEVNPNHFYEEAGTYTIQLQVIDEFGCVSVYEQVIQVSDDYWVKVPNAFTPFRADGKNSFFKPVFRGIASMEFYIFTTWGELIYESNSLEDQGWDGQFKGVEATNGNYVYRGKFTSNSGEVVEKSGVFILIR
ncbi:gliding motility-associated C-terminal domain-containing protein [Algoriphagus faecimaris]|uniref:Gliding motility-associated C-terminal domain-containing protein n=1 Tax=Algoriphagus faecimaris TaxID=686796 RepID=A0A1G6PUJ1_9BACT|nr:PKD domain-containing protein [Algoriphagus faecimaris]SDC83708.1 gliding motility-associated C-terminal domain-containing protein [Algoriphagus faecimaris]